jgi:tetratricopeptide (TPR) repeat protein
MKLDESQPLYIVELGAGSGKFSYFMLKALDEMKYNCLFPFNKIIFVMTDFTQNNFNFWSNHTSLKPYFDSGHLDAAIFDAVQDTKINLWKSGKVLDVSSCVNPIVIVANYLFDTLYHDIFQVDKGELKEGLVSVGSKHAFEPDPLHPDIINRLDNLYSYNTISPISYYTNEEGDEESLSFILNWYKNYYKEESEGASILLPIGAIRALRRLSKLSNERMIVISGDKGNNNPSQFVGLADPHIAIHGSFSLMVNYHAIGAWFSYHGGFSLHNPQEEASLKVSCFVLDNGLKNNNPIQKLDYHLSDTETTNDLFVNIDRQRSIKYPSLMFSFEESLNLFGPNDFFVLQKSLKDDMNGIPLRTVVSLLKLSDWDPDIFFKFRDCILQNSPTCSDKLRNDLCRGVPRIWINNYPLDSEKDIAFEIGRFYYGIKDFAKALEFYDMSVDTVGQHHVTCHNQGLCYYSLGQRDKALEHFKKASLIDPSYEKARSWVDKVDREEKENSGLTTSLNPDSSSATIISTLDVDDTVDLGVTGLSNLVQKVINMEVQTAFASS